MTKKSKWAHRKYIYYLYLSPFGNEISFPNIDSLKWTGIWTRTVEYFDSNPWHFLVPNTSISNGKSFICERDVTVNEFTFPTKNVSLLTILIEIKMKAPRNCWLLGKIRQRFSKPDVLVNGMIGNFHKRTFIRAHKRHIEKLGLGSGCCFFLLNKSVIKDGRNGEAIHSFCLLSHSLRVITSQVPPCFFFFLVFFLQ